MQSDTASAVVMQTRQGAVTTPQERKERKMKAERSVETWNMNYKKNGTYMFDELLKRDI